MRRRPTPYLLGILRWHGEENEYGDVVDDGLPGDPEPWPVHRIAPAVMEEPEGPSREQDVARLQVSAPVSGPMPGVRDKVVWLDGLDDLVRWDVDGEPRDWSKGPWRHPFNQSFTVEIVRVRG